MHGETPYLPILEKESSKKPTDEGFYTGMLGGYSNAGRVDCDDSVFDQKRRLSFGRWIDD